MIIVRRLLGSVIPKSGRTSLRVTIPLEEQEKVQFAIPLVFVLLQLPLQLRVGEA